MSQKLKLSPETIAVLKNFSGISKSIVVRPGSQLETVTTTKSLASQATVPEVFEETFGIWDLPQFLSTLSLFQDPELKVSDKKIEISESGKRLSYTCSPPEMILTLPSEAFEKLENLTGSSEVVFDLSNDQFQAASKALSVLKVPEYKFVGDGKSIRLIALDSSNDTGNRYEIVLVESEAVFEAVFAAENVRFIPADYRVSISDKGLAKFESENIKYFVSSEAKKG
jgi:hypothetical protein